jgi:putative transposase
VRLLKIRVALFPRTVVFSYEMEKESSYKHLHHYNNPGHAHELTFTCYHRYPYLLDENACSILRDTIENARHIYSFHLWAYVFMPNHVHLLLWPQFPEYDISKILSGIKGIMSKAYRSFLQQNNVQKLKDFIVADNNFRFWQPGGGFDRNLWNAKAIHDLISYIEANPVRAKLVGHKDDWKWSSAYARKNKVGLEPDKFNMPVLLQNAQKQRVGVL